jgi:hypothetical protein
MKECIDAHIENGYTTFTESKSGRCPILHLRNESLGRYITLRKKYHIEYAKEKLNG